jgi:lantibiotic leader peptide-processing serine protease
MRSRTIGLGWLAGFLVLAGCAEEATTPLAPESAAHSVAGQETQRYILLMRGAGIPVGLAARVAAEGGQLVRTMPQVGIAIAESSREGFAGAMARDPRVQSVGLEPVFTLPEVVDGVGGELPSAMHEPTPADDLYNLGLVWGVERVNAPAAWALGEAYTGSGAMVGIIDTGIASNHPDLSTNVVFNSCFSSQGDVVGRNWEAGDPCNPYPSLSDHGTHVAGTAAARFGGGRVVGVAPNAKLANYNVFELIPNVGVRAFTSSRWRAMIHSADTRVDVINMSLGSFGFRGHDPKKYEAFGIEFDPGRDDGLATFIAAEKRVTDYVIRNGTVIVSAAGNSGANLSSSYIAIPADVPGQLSVGATGIRPNPRFEPGISTDVLAFFSNYGGTVDLVAPGGDCGLADDCDVATRPANWFEFLVLSTIVAPGQTCAQTRSCPVGYGWKGGTSMAAPHVAGVAAIVRATSPEASPPQVNSILTRTAENLGDPQLFARGMVDAAAAATAP